ncbi:hypothetical protein Tco_0088077 [Tanacetum coccineum]
MIEKGDTCVMWEYSIQSKGYRFTTRITLNSLESIHIKFDEIKEMILVPEVKGIDYDNYDPVPPRQNVVYSRETDCHNKGWNSLQSFTEEITSAHVGIEFEDSISLQFASLEAVRIFVAHEEVYVAQPEGFVDIQIIQKKNVTFKKALYRCLKQDPRACHKVVRLGINPMIQPEPEDLPKDNPKLEIAVLRHGYTVSSLMDTAYWLSEYSIGSVVYEYSFIRLGKDTTSMPLKLRSLISTRRSLTFLKAATSGANRPDAANFYQS